MSVYGYPIRACPRCGSSSFTHDFRTDENLGEIHYRVCADCGYSEPQFTKAQIEIQERLDAKEQERRDAEARRWYEEERERNRFYVVYASTSENGGWSEKGAFKDLQSAIDRAKELKSKYHSTSVYYFPDIKKDECRKEAEFR